MADTKARTVKQLAAHWQVSERHVYAMIADRRLGHIRVGTLIRVRQHAVPILRPGRVWLFEERAETAFRESTRMFQDPVSKEKRRRAAMKVPSSSGAYERVLALASKKAKAPRQGRI